VLRADSIISVPQELGRGDGRVCIAILDGPVDLSHPCFHGAKLTQLQTLVDPTLLGGRAATHGTHVASIIFGQPGSAVPGIAPHCSGLVVPIFSDEAPNRSLACSQLDLARAILLAAENGAHVINISGGQLTPSGEPEPMLAQAIESCRTHNILIVAAAGNDGCECLHVPAAAPSVLVVGAMDRDGNPLTSSNWGGAYRDQGILAPGMDVLGAVPGGTACNSGTSFAAPIVSALAGLLLSRQIKRGEKPNPHAVRAALLKSATPCLPGTAADCRRFLVGRLNIHGATEQLARGDHHMTDLKALLPSEDSVPARDDAWRQSSDGAGPIIAAGVAIEAGAVRMSEELPAEVISASNLAPAARSKLQAPLPPPKRAPGQVTLSDCGCGCGGAQCTCGGGTQKPALVYALGKLGYDFGSEARHDSFAQAMPTEANNPLIPDQLLGYLEQNPYEASSLTWTLNLDATPIYAIQPAGPFAENAYERLREFLRAQLHEGVELVSIPGIIAGSVRLQSGMAVPVVVPAVRGMYSWATTPLVEHVLGERPTAAAALASYDNLASGLADFLNQIYYGMRNLGLTAEERALNYSATNAMQVSAVIRSATQQELDFGVPTVKKSPVCRPDSDCYDVELPFFDPNNTNRASRIYRFTVDVSDIIPVTIGAVRSWTRQ
jgi:cyanobactin maturation PatA/PatG family protease